MKKRHILILLLLLIGFHGITMSLTTLASSQDTLFESDATRRDQGEFVDLANTGPNRLFDELIVTDDPYGTFIQTTSTSLSIQPEKTQIVSETIPPVVISPSPPSPLPLTSPAVPEPATLILFGAGLIGLLMLGRRRLRKKE